MPLFLSIFVISLKKTTISLKHKDLRKIQISAKTYFLLIYSETFMHQQNQRNNI